MNFEWILILEQWVLRHTTLLGQVIDVAEKDVEAYLAGLHASEKQQPVPAKPETQAAPKQDLIIDPEKFLNQVATDPAIQAAALEKPDAVSAAIHEAMSQAVAAREAAATHAMSATDSAALAQDSAIRAEAALTACQGTLATMERLLATIPHLV